MKYVMGFLVALLVAPAWAARPLITDDARLTTAGSCQLESWMRIYPDSRERWALPACNPGGNLEITVGEGVARNGGEAATRDYVFQAKTLFKPLEANGWGWGLGVGTVRHPDSRPGPNGLGNTYFYFPVSASFNDDRLVVHLNLGWSRDRESGNVSTTWGLASEYLVTPRFTAIAETFGDNHNTPYWQLGGRFTIRPNLFQVDATIGQQFSGPSAGRWMSLGLRITPEHLF